MNFGMGVLDAKSTKQKLNTKSSTEAELVGASDYIPWTIWIKRFMKYQGYDIKSSIFYQDSESANKLEENGRKSCGEKSHVFLLIIWGCIHLFQTILYQPEL